MLFIVNLSHLLYCCPLMLVCHQPSLLLHPDLCRQRRVEFHFYTFTHCTHIHTIHTHHKNRCCARRAYLGSGAVICRVKHKQKWCAGRPGQTNYLQSEQKVIAKPT